MSSGVVAAFIAVLGLATPAPGQTPPPPEPAEKEEPKKDGPKPVGISGYVFGDYYYFAQDHDANFDGQNGFWIRRAYLTVDRDLSSAWGARFRLEVNSPSLQQTQDTLEPYVKDAYLRWTHGTHNVFFGISPSPTWELIEGFWGYRHVEKTALDLHSWASSRDTGLAAKGSFDKDKQFGYHAMIGAGTGVRNEVNDEKRVYLALSARPSKTWVFEAYADFESRPDDLDIRTLQAFGGYEGKSVKLALQYARQTRQQGPAKDDLHLDLLSAFATGKLSPKLLWLARVDRGFDPDPAGAGIAYLPFDPTARSTFVLAGLEFLPVPSVHLTPNLEVITYDDATPEPRTDLVGRLTLYWTF